MNFTATHELTELIIPDLRNFLASPDKYSWFCPKNFSQLGKPYTIKGRTESFQLVSATFPDRFRSYPHILVNPAITNFQRLDADNIIAQKNEINQYGKLDPEGYIVGGKVNFNVTFTMRTLNREDAEYLCDVVCYYLAEPGFQFLKTKGVFIQPPSISGGIVAENLKESTDSKRVYSIRISVSGNVDWLKLRTINGPLVEGIPTVVVTTIDPGSGGGTVDPTPPSGIQTDEIADKAVTFAKMQDIGPNTVMGRGNVGIGPPTLLACYEPGRGLLAAVSYTEQRTLLGLGNLAIRDTVNTGSIEDDAVTLAKIENINAFTLLGQGATSGSPQQLTLSNDLSIMGTQVQLSNTTVTPGTYTNATLEVDAKGRVISINSGNPPGMAPWLHVVMSTVNLAPSNGYILDNTSEVFATLPTNIAVGEYIFITGVGTGGWRILQNPGQRIHSGLQSTTTGTSGYLKSTEFRDSVLLICVVANQQFNAVSIIGNLDFH